MQLELIRLLSGQELIWCEFTYTICIHVKTGWLTAFGAPLHQVAQHVVYSCGGEIIDSVPLTTNLATFQHMLTQHAYMLRRNDWRRSAHQVTQQWRGAQWSAIRVWSAQELIWCELPILYVTCDPRNDKWQILWNHIVIIMFLLKAILKVMFFVHLNQTWINTLTIYPRQ